MTAFSPSPPITFSEAKVAAFEALYQAAKQHGPTQAIAYHLPYPKYEFLSYVTEQHPIILHGSDNPAIERFETIRRGFDLNPHGNVMGIYGTNDGIWPIFFAILDHRVYKGSMRNGVWYELEDGTQVDFRLGDVPAGAAKRYWFSLNAEMLPRFPWAEGTVYLLPKETFEQLRDKNGTLLAEWASHQPVIPLAKISVTPQDFPFLDQVNGHDDSQVLHLQQLLSHLAQTCQQAEELPDGFALCFEWQPNQAQAAFDWLRLTREAIPLITNELISEAQQGPLWLKIHGPQTIKNLIGRELAKHPAKGVAK